MAMRLVVVEPLATLVETPQSTARPDRIVVPLDVRFTPPSRFLLSRGTRSRPDPLLLQHSWPVV
jgi:hypothetical protein